MNSLSKLVAILLVILLLFIFPISNTYDRKDDISYLIVYKAITKFVDASRNKGYISPTMYEDFMREIDATGNLYEVEIEHYHKRYTPVYTDPADSSTFQNRIYLDYDAYYEPQIMQVIFPDNSKPKDDPSRLYKMNVGDYIYVTVKSLNKTQGQIMQDFLFTMNSDSSRIYIPYGGMIHNEDY